MWLGEKHAQPCMQVSDMTGLNQESQEAEGVLVSCNCLNDIAMVIIRTLAGLRPGASWAYS